MLESPVPAVSVLNFQTQKRLTGNRFAKNYFFVNKYLAAQTIKNRNLKRCKEIEN